LPPFFSLLVDQSLDREHAIEVLKQMPRGYKEFRDVRKQFMQELIIAKNLNDQINVINEWNIAW
jgi:GTP1/Obg family GTP-binding protein